MGRQMLNRTMIASAAIAIAAIAVAGISITRADGRSNADVAAVAGAVAGFAAGTMVLSVAARPRTADAPIYAERVHRPFCRIETTRERDTFSGRWNIYTERSC